MKAYKKTIPNGVRIITIPMKDNPAVTVMVLAGTGSNNEKKDNKGIAHFLEHMCFKGGDTYKSAYEVSTALDSLGAESNAFTGHEFTGYYAKGASKHFSKMLDVVSDIYLNATLPSEELEKERGVILEEINMYHDHPPRYVQDLFFKVLYGDQPAGWHTLGTKDSVASMPREMFVDFKNKHYTAPNTVVIVAGQIDKARVIKEVQDTFADQLAKPAPKRKKTKDTQKTPQLIVEKRTTGQTHMILGVRAFKASDKRSATLDVLNALLGGGMSSRLFQKLREEMGVCYYVRSSVSLHDAHGFMAVSAGVDTKRLNEVTKVILDEFKKLQIDSVEESELKKAKEYLVGQLYLGLEESAGVAEFYLEQELLVGQLKTPKAWEREIRAVSAADVQRLARLMFKNNRLNMAVVGNIRDESKLKGILHI